MKSLTSSKISKFSTDQIVLGTDSILLTHNLKASTHVRISISEGSDVRLWN